MEKTTKRLAEDLKNNWMFHDNKNYLAIRENSKTLLQLLGYDFVKSEKASFLIMNIFRLADEAQQYQFADKDKEKEIYSVIIKRADELDDMLERNRNSKYEIYWWRTIRHKKYLISIINLFRDQLYKLGVRNIYQVIRCTLLLVNTGKAHDKKNWNDVVTCLEKYFEIIRKLGVKNFLEF